MASSRAIPRRAASAASVDACPAKVGTGFAKKDMRKNSLSRRGVAACIAIALTLPNLAHAGDFGRPKPSLLEGLIAKQFWKGPVTGYSIFPLTDLEEQLRDRSYALIRPNEPRGNWNIYIAGFQIAHLLPPGMTYFDYTEYARMLLWTLSRSEASLYNRLIEDLNTDGQLVGPFVAVACAVAD